MTIPVYAEIDQNNTIFDGQKARVHLIKHLGFSLVKGNEEPKLMAHFDKWIEPYHSVLNISKDGPWFLV